LASISSEALKENCDKTSWYSSQLRRKGESPKASEYSLAMVPAPRRCTIQLPSLVSKTPYTQSIMHAATCALMAWDVSLRKDSSRDRRARVLCRSASAGYPRWKAQRARMADLRLWDAWDWGDSAIGISSWRKPFSASSSVVIKRASLASSGAAFQSGYSLELVG